MKQIFSCFKKLLCKRQSAEDSNNAFATDVSDTVSTLRQACLQRRNHLIDEMDRRIGAADDEQLKAVFSKKGVTSTGNIACVYSKSRFAYKLQGR
jgi:uncharacterized FlgJ-related protein